MSTNRLPNDRAGKPASEPAFWIPPIQVGPVAPEAGEWSRLIMLFGWACARAKNGQLKGEILPAIQSSRPLREPCLHVSDEINGEIFYRQIGGSLSHVEAVAGQITGHEAPSPCTHCQRGLCKFNQCIIMYADGSLTYACCYWRRKYKECSFYRATGEIPTSEARRTVHFEF
ncbi:Protein of unknown function DUF3716 [Penicillium angulare]|uniref:Protein of unknown function DUF3716 n=1 Tax=Penicillium angulare TaxID=116970 RepID=UPI0025402DDF|nr:Protein of unknown function DUF3716 [Penicillium angulare]KAJ5261339.1 Protein of unknown function DUF3716 [Penicillium angulare]